jgi:hypothetical protein
MSMFELLAVPQRGVAYLRPSSKVKFLCTPWGHLGRVGGY